MSSSVLSVTEVYGLSAHSPFFTPTTASVSAISDPACQLQMKGLKADPFPRVGGRVVLRRLRPGDVKEFQAYRTDPEVGRFQGWSPMTFSEAKIFLSDMSKMTFGVTGTWFQLGIAERTTDRLIGDIGLCICGPDNEHAELGFSLARDWQGQGLASEAVREVIDLLFESTLIARVVSIADSRNQGCIRLLQRIGMRQIGAVNLFFQGEPCVDYVYMAWRPVGSLKTGG